MRRLWTFSGATMLAILLAWPAGAQNSGVNLTVNEASKTPKADDSGTKKRNTAESRAQHVEEKELQVTLRNFSQRTYTGVVLRYYVFAKDLQTKETVIAGTGEEMVTLTPGLVKPVATKTVRFTYSQAYTKKKGGKITAVDPEGLKYQGYGVQAWLGDSLLAEKFNPLEMKTALGTAWVQLQDPKKKRPKKDPQ